MSALVFNKATDNYLFTIAEARGAIGDKLRLRSADSTSVLDLSNNGNIELSGNVNVTGTLSLNDASISATSSDTVTITNSSSQNGTRYITFVDDTSGSNSVEVDTGLYYNPFSGLLTTQAVSVQDLSAGATDISSTLHVDGVVTLSSTLDVIGDTSVSTFDSTGATSLATGGGAVNIASSGQMTTVKGTLNVDEEVTLDDNLIVGTDLLCAKTSANSINSKVGIGINVPLEKLHIKNTGADTYLRVQSDNAYEAGIKFNDGTTTIYSLYSNNNSNILNLDGEANKNLLKIQSLNMQIGSEQDSDNKTVTNRCKLQVNKSLTVEETTTLKGNVQIGIGDDANLQIGSGVKGGQIYSTATDHELVIDPFTIDGSGSTTTDASGTVTILGNLVVRGNTTTFHSATLDVSDHNLTIASGTNVTSGMADGAGITIGNDAYATFNYVSSGSKWATNIPLDVSGALVVADTLSVAGASTLTGATSLSNTLSVTGATTLTGAATLSDSLSVTGATTLTGAATLSDSLSVTGASTLTGATTLSDTLSVTGATTLTGAATLQGATNLNNTLSVTGKITATDGLDISGHLLPTTNATQIPVTKSTFKLKTDGLTDLSNTNLTTEGWQDATGYDLSKTLLSANSLVKMEFKVNFISSPEADQTLSFRVLRSTNGGTNYTDTVFTDENIGSNMGVTIRSVYNGTYIDTPGGTNVAYKLQFKREGGTDIDTNFGIVSGGNYIFLQELYAP